MALEAIRGDLTLAELAAKRGVHHTMIASWKQQAIEGMACTFSGLDNVARASSESEVEKLYGSRQMARHLRRNGRMLVVVGCGG